MNQLGGSRQIVQNKLIIMYIIQNLNGPVTNNNITKIILQTRLMNYFVLQQCLTDLLESKLISLDSSTNASDKTESYSITDSGAKTLNYFQNLIPPGIKKRIDKVLLDSSKELQTEAQVTADFTPESEDKFNVTCKIGEKDFQLIELNVAVGTKKDAREVCDNWIKHSSEIYAEIIESLTKKRDE
jgi:predicted transcriptional regulator